MTSFVLKIIALITMFCDHIGYPIMDGFSFFNYIGRIAFPIFAFQISEGFIHTKNLRKYFIKLVIFAFISQIPFQMYVNKFLPSSSFGLNIFFTLFFGLLSIVIYDFISKKNSDELNCKVFGIPFKKMLGIMFVFCIAYIGNWLNVDYGFWGIIVIFSFYLFKNNKLAMVISYITLCIIRYGINMIMYYIIFHTIYIPYIYLALMTILPIVFISLYNGNQGYKIKYGLYVFYPLHLLLLYLFM